MQSVIIQASMVPAQKPQHLKSSNRRSYEIKRVAEKKQDEENMIVTIAPRSYSILNKTVQKTAISLKVILSRISRIFAALFLLKISTCCSNRKEKNIVITQQLQVDFDNFISQLYTCACIEKICICHYNCNLELEEVTHAVCILSL